MNHVHPAPGAGPALVSRAARSIEVAEEALLLDALRPGAMTAKLPGTPASDAGLGERWIPAG